MREDWADNAQALRQLGWNEPRQRNAPQLAPAYVLHHRPWGDSGRIFDVFAREHGRLTVFARGVRGPKAKLAACCSPSCRCWFPGRPWRRRA